MGRREAEKGRGNMFITYTCGRLQKTIHFKNQGLGKQLKSVVFLLSTHTLTAALARHSV